MKKNLAIVLTVALAVSCNGILDLTPTSSVSSRTMWESTANAEYSVNYLFTFFWNYNAYPTQLGLTEALTDELKYTSYNFNAMAYIPSYISYLLWRNNRHGSDLRRISWQVGLPLHKHP